MPTSQYLLFNQCANDVDFQSRVAWAVRQMAVQVIMESPATTNHAARLVLANKIISGTQLANSQQYAVAVITASSAVQAALKNCLDTDIFNIINTVLYDPYFIAFG